MKARLLSIVIAAICFCITACRNHQTDEPNTDRVVYLADSAYLYSIDADNNETLTQLTYFSYDANGNMTLQFDTVIMPEAYVTKRKTMMQYDAKGNLKEHKFTSYSKFSARWQNGRCTLYDYNAQNKLSIVTFYEQYSDPLSNPSKKIVYTWIDDEHASCLSYDYYKYETGDPWTLTQRLESTYNAQGKVIKDACYMLIKEINQERLLVSNTYEYDKYDNLVLHISVNHQDGGSSSRSYKYEYDENGNILIGWYGNGNSKEENIRYTEKCVYFY